MPDNISKLWNAIQSEGWDDEQTKTEASLREYLKTPGNSEKLRQACLDDGWDDDQIQSKEAFDAYLGINQQPTTTANSGISTKPMDATLKNNIVNGVNAAVSAPHKAESAMETFGLGNTMSPETKTFYDQQAANMGTAVQRVMSAPKAQTADDKQVEQNQKDTYNWLTKQWDRFTANANHPAYVPEQAPDFATFQNLLRNQSFVDEINSYKSVYNDSIKAEQQKYAGMQMLDPDSVSDNDKVRALTGKNGTRYLYQGNKVVGKMFRLYEGDDYHWIDEEGNIVEARPETRNTTANRYMQNPQNIKTLDAIWDQGGDAAVWDYLQKQKDIVWSDTTEMKDAKGKTTGYSSANLNALFQAYYNNTHHIEDIMDSYIKKADEAVQKTTEANVQTATQATAAIPEQARGLAYAGTFGNLNKRDDVKRKQCEITWEQMKNAIPGFKNASKEQQQAYKDQYESRYATHLAEQGVSGNQISYVLGGIADNFLIKGYSGSVKTDYEKGIDQLTKALDPNSQNLWLNALRGGVTFLSESPLYKVAGAATQAALSTTANAMMKGIGSWKWMRSLGMVPKDTIVLKDLTKALAEEYKVAEPEAKKLAMKVLTSEVENYNIWKCLQPIFSGAQMAGTFGGKETFTGMLDAAVDSHTLNADAIPTTDRLAEAGQGATPWGTVAEGLAQGAWSAVGGFLAGTLRTIPLQMLGNSGKAWLNALASTTGFGLEVTGMATEDTLHQMANGQISNFGENWVSTLVNLGMFHIPGMARMAGTRRWTEADISNEIIKENDRREAAGQLKMTAAEETAFKNRFVNQENGQYNTGIALTRDGNPVKTIYENVRRNMREKANGQIWSRDMSWTKSDRELLAKTPDLAKLLNDVYTAAQDTRNSDGFKGMDKEKTRQLLKKIAEISQNHDEFPETFINKLIYRVTGNRFISSPVAHISYEGDDDNIIIATDDAGRVIDRQEFDTMEEAEDYADRYQGQLDVAELQKTAGAITMRDMMEHRDEWLAEFFVEGKQLTESQSKSGSELTELEDAKAALYRGDITDNQIAILNYELSKKSDAVQKVKQRAADENGWIPEQIDAALAGHDLDEASQMDSNPVNIGGGRYRTRQEQQMVDAFKDAVSEEYDALQNGEEPTVTTVTPEEEAQQPYVADTTRKAAVHNEMTAMLQGQRVNPTETHRAMVENQRAKQILLDNNITTPEDILRVAGDENYDAQLREAAQTYLNTNEAAKGISEAVETAVNDQVAARRQQLAAIESHTMADAPMGITLRCKVKATGKEGYIVKGHPDGDPFVKVLFDGDTEPTDVKADQIDSESITETSIEDQLAQYETAVRQNAEGMAEAARHGGMLQAGEELLVDGKMGKLLGVAADENGQPTSGFAVEVDGKQVVMSRQQIYDARDAKMLADMEQQRTAEENRQKVEEQAQQRREEAKKVKPSDVAKPGDVVVLTDEDGNEKAYQVMQMDNQYDKIHLTAGKGDYVTMSASELQSEINKAAVRREAKLGTLIEAPNGKGQIKTWEVIKIDPTGILLKNEDGQYMTYTPLEFENAVRDKLNLPRVNEAGEIDAERPAEQKAEKTPTQEAEEALDESYFEDAVQKEAERIKRSGRDPKTGKFVAFPKDENGNVTFKPTDVPELYQMLEENGMDVVQQASKEIADLENQISALQGKELEGSDINERMAAKKANDAEIRRLTTLRNNWRLFLAEKGKEQLNDPKFTGLTENALSYYFRQQAPEWADFYDQLAKKFGTRIVLVPKRYKTVNGEQTSDIVNGENNEKENVIYLNVDAYMGDASGNVDITPDKQRKTALDYLNAVFGHELTHSVFRENKDLMNLYVKAVENYMGKDAFDAQCKAKGGDYRASDVREEVACDMAGQLIGNKDFITRLLDDTSSEPEGVRPKPVEERLSILNKAKNAFTNFVNKLRGVNVPDVQSKDVHEDAMTQMQNELVSQFELAEAAIRARHAKDEKSYELRMKAEAERQRLEAEARARAMEAAQKRYDKIINDAREEMKDDDQALEILDRREPESLEEAISISLPAHSLLLNDYTDGMGRTVRGLKSETGLNYEDLKRLSYFIGSKDGQGKTVDQVAEEMWADFPSDIKARFSSVDTKHALLDMVMSSQSAADIRHLIDINRIDEARSVYNSNIEMAERYADEQANAAAMYGNKPSYSVREKPAPQKTVPCYKLMRLGDDGNLYPLFIDAAEPTELGKWYDADAPDLEWLKPLASGTWLVDPKNKTAITEDEFFAQHPELEAIWRGKRTKYPSVNAVNWATKNGLRFMNIEDTARGQKRFNGENRKYWNLGINGSGSVSTFSMRPGWHAASLPTMRQIGKGANQDLRDDRFVWVEGELSADKDYNDIVKDNPDKDMPDRIPEDGFYLKATNADKAKSQSDVVGWYVAGAFKPTRIMSDAETKAVIDNWNAEHPEAQAEYDYPRESGRVFNAETMRMEDVPNTAYSMRQNAAIDDTFKKIEDEQQKVTDLISKMKDDPVDEATLNSNMRKLANLKHEIGADKVDTFTSENPGVKFSVRANMEGAGLTASTDVDGTSRPMTDKEGNMMVKLDGKEFTGKNPLTVEDLKSSKNSILNYMMKDAVEVFHSITPEKAEQIYQKYTDLMNFYLRLGMKENGGVSTVTDKWQWLGETVFRSVASNGDTQYLKSIDITRICKKNEAVINAISELQSRLRYGVTPAQILDLYGTTIDEGYQAPCPVCYVFTRYIRNGKLSSAAINGMRKYGKHLPGQAREWSVKQWVNELDRLEGIKAQYKKDIDRANDIVVRYPDMIDELAKKITNPDTPEKEKKALRKEVERLDADYRKALDVFSQQCLTQWIKNFVLESKNSNWKIREDAKLPEDMTDFENHALDLRLTGSAMIKYPAIQRLRKSLGSAGGKEITQASNNEFGMITQLLGAGKPEEGRNFYLEATQAKDEKTRKKLLNDATKTFGKAVLYARQQTLRGGQRMWSWSDNIERLANDVAINLMQMDILGGAVQTYSKQLEGINLVARMGAYVNGSLMGKGIGYKEINPEDVQTLDNGMTIVKDGGFEVADKHGNKKTLYSQAYYDEASGKWYTLEFDDVVGIDAFGKTAEDGHHLKGLFDLNNQLDKAGNILVGMNDIHCKAAMADDRVFFIIPWHSSGANSHVLAQMYEYLGSKYDTSLNIDYTEMQEDADMCKPSNGAFPTVNDRLRNIWESHKNETDFECGIEGGVDSSAPLGHVTPSQLKYRAVRDAILIGIPRDETYVDKNGATKIRTVYDKVETNQEYMDIIDHDAFLKQVKAKVDAFTNGEGMTKDDCNHIYPYEYWDETSTFDKASINGARYLEYCRRMGEKPKFCGKINATSEVEAKKGYFIDEPGYWKTLIDRRMYDCDGNFQDLTPVSVDGFEPKLIDPAETAKEFKVTKVADAQGTSRIVDKTMQRENDRTGSIPNINYKLNMKRAVARFNSDRAKPTAGIVYDGEQKYSVRSATDNNGDYSSENPDIRYSVRGEKGAKALDILDGTTERMDNLEKAKRMFKAVERGKKVFTPLQIKKATGWELGVDNKWRLESDKDGQFYNFSELKNWKNQYDNAPLYAIWRDSELYEAYPELANIKVYKISRKSGAEGSFNGAYFEINTNRPEEKVRKTLIHEIQHYIQRQEGFARGGNDEMTFDHLKILAEEQDEAAAKLSKSLSKKYPLLSAFGEYGSVDSLNTDYKGLKKTLSAIRDYKELMGDYPEFFEGLTRKDVRNFMDSFGSGHSDMRKRISQIYGGDPWEHPIYKTLEDINRNNWHLDENPANIDDVDEMEDKVLDVIEKIDKFEKKWNKTWNKIGFDGFRAGGRITFDDYLRLAGEVESRNASKRADMTPEQRRGKLLSSTEDVKRKNQLIRYDSHFVYPQDKQPMFSVRNAQKIAKDIVDGPESLVQNEVGNVDWKDRMSNEGNARWDIYSNKLLQEARKHINAVSKWWGGQIGNAAAGAFNYAGEVQGTRDLTKAQLIADDIIPELRDYRDALERVKKANNAIYNSKEYAKVFDDAIDKVDEAIRWYTKFGEGGNEKIDDHWGIKYSTRIEQSDPFYSNAAKAVEGIKQDKATPDQWLKMIEKAGGLKKEEDKWMGLSEWLRQQQAMAVVGDRPKTVTRQEVEDFIAQNAVKVEEVNYSENGKMTDEQFEAMWDAEGLPNRAQQFHDNIQDEFADLEEENGFDEAYDMMVDKYGEMFKETYPKEEQDPGEPLMYSYTDPLLVLSGIKTSMGETNDAHAIEPIRLDYTTEGLTDKREIALTVPTIEPYNQHDNIHFGDAGEGRAVAWVRFGDAQTMEGAGEKAQRSIADELEAKYHTLNPENMTPEDAAKKYYGDFLARGEYGSHDVNLMFIKDEMGDKADATIKAYFKIVNESSKKGSKVLVIDEIQSKRHQDAREKGYVETAEHEQFEEFKKSLDEIYGEGWSYDDLDDDDAMIFDSLSSNLYRDTQDKVPDAPFRSTWHELAMKRILRYAAEHGYDKVAWTTGAQQAERYSLSKSIKDITWQKGKNSSDGHKTPVLHDNDGKAIVALRVNADGIVEKEIGKTSFGYVGKPLSDVVGKDIADKIMTESEGKLEGEQLAVGGEGMKGFYDNMLVKYMNKYGKKWGAKVSDIELDLPRPQDRVMHAVDVTPQMKESVMQGQPMFSVRDAEPAGDIHTDNFKAWFGDWQKDPEKASKVVDEDGKPLVVFHGTDKYGFKTFKESETGTFFTDSTNTAEYYHSVDNNRNDGTYKCYLDIKKPFVIDCKGNVYSRLSNHVNGIKLPSDYRYGYYADTEGWAKYIKQHPELGYDGVIFRNIIDSEPERGETTVYNVFEPTQIKSATDNNGGYDPNNPDIRYSARQTDAEYMDAVKSGDMDKAESMVKDAIAKAMPDTKVVGKDGKPLTLYHETNNDWTVADVTGKHSAAGRTDYLTPFGIFLKPTEKKIGVGKKQMALYADIKNPLEVADRDELANWMRENIKGFGGFEKFDDEGEQFMMDILTDSENLMDEGNVKESDKKYDEYMQFKKNHADALASIKKILDRQMRKTGYDGIHILKDDGSRGRTVETWIALNPNQVKSVEAVTYNNRGNVIPLSKRFNAENNDIRYSTRLNEEIATAQKTVTDQIKSLMDNKLVSSMQKSDLTKLMNQIRFATPENITQRLRTVQRRVMGIESRVIGKEISDYLNLKNQDVNGKNMSIAKNVDNQTRQVMNNVKERMYGVTNTDADETIHQLGSEIWHLRDDNRQLAREIAASEQRGFPWAAGSQEYNDAKAQIEQNENLIAAKVQEQKDMKAFRDQTVKANIEFGGRDILEQIADLEAKKEEAFDPDSNVKWTDEDRVNEITLDVLKDRVEIEKTYQQLYEARQNRSNAATANERRAWDAMCDSLESEQFIQLTALRDKVKNLVEGGKESLATLKQKEMEHKSEILTGVMDDIAGKKASYDPHKEEGKDQNTIKAKIEKFFHGTMSPLRTFAYMCESLDRNHMAGDGFLTRYFLKGKNGVMEANNRYLKGFWEASETLNKKTSEIFGKDMVKVAAEGKKASSDHGITTIIEETDEKGNVINVKRIPLTYKGNDKPMPISKNEATYLYMVWQMPDGRAKLMNEGFDEQSIEELKEYVGAERIKWADYVQQEYLPSLFPKYNQKYLEIYGTPMKQNDNYIPLRYDKTALKTGEEETLANGGQAATKLQSKNSFTINRVMNLLPVSKTTDCFDIVMDHVREAEEFTAYADVRRDLDTVLGSKAVKAVMNRNSRDAYNDFVEACKVATKNYGSDAKSIDNFFNSVTRGLVGANIAFRVGTAIKQTTSVPAFMAYSLDPKYQMYFGKSLVKNYGGNILGIAGGAVAKETLLERLDEGKYAGFTKDFKWAMDNIPSFRNRLQVGDLGQEILNMDRNTFRSKLMQHGMYANQMIDATTCLVGIKAVYDYNMDKARKEIDKLNLTPEERQQRLDEAHRMACMEADICYNSSQQSSNEAFLSPLQASNAFYYKALMAYKNSPVSYARHAILGVKDFGKFLKNRNRLMSSYTQMYKLGGYDDAEASQMAKAKINQRARESFARIGMYGFVLGAIWQVAGKGVFGMFMNDDQKDELWTLANAMKCISGGGVPLWDMAAGVASGDGYGVMLASDELTDIIKDAKKLQKEIGEDPYWGKYDAAITAMQKLSRFYGVDLETAGNVFLGIEEMIRQGMSEEEIDAALNTEYILNIAKTNRKSSAMQIYIDKDAPELTETMTRAAKMFTTDDFRRYVPGAKTLDAKAFKEIANSVNEAKGIKKENIKDMGMAELTEAFNKEKDPLRRQKIADKMADIDKKQYEAKDSDNFDYGKATMAERYQHVTVGDQPKPEKEPKTEKTRRKRKAQAVFIVSSTAANVKAENEITNKLNSIEDHDSKLYKKLKFVKGKYDSIKMRLAEDNLSNTDKVEILKQLANTRDFMKRLIQNNGE